MSNGIDSEAIEAFRSLADELEMGERIAFDEPLGRRSSLRIGGPATIWAEIATLGELDRLWGLADSMGLPTQVVGLGSNVLFPDDGFRGLIVRLVGELAEWSVESGGEDTTLVGVGGGTINAHLVRGVHREGLVGAGFLALIPGTFGGAVALNAGTKDAELSEVLVDVDIWHDGQLQTWDAEELKLSYRHSELPEGAVVVGGRIRVEPGDVDGARQAVHEDKARRDRTQPYRLASVGSTFANPDGDYAGRLIDEAGLKGRSIGGARISELHANFFINEDDATAEDFLSLMALARYEVRRQFGVELRPEVRFVGLDGWTRLEELEGRLEKHGC